MAERGERQTIHRLGVDKETSFGVASGTVKAQREIQGGGIVADQDMAEDQRWSTDQNEPYAPILGEKTSKTDWMTPYHRDWVADLDDVLKSTLGAKTTAGAAITIGAGPNNASQFTFTAGTVSPGDWVEITTNTGRRIYVVVKAVSGGVATFAWQIALGAETMSTIKQADKSAGAQYTIAPAGAVDTFTLLADAGAEPDQENYLAHGSICTQMLLEVGLGQARKFLALNFEGCDWDQQTGSLANPAAATADALTWATELYVDSNLAAPIAAVPLVGAYYFKADLAPSWDRQDAFKSRSGATLATIPGSPAIAFRRGKYFAGGVEFKQDYADPQWQAGHAARTKYQVALLSYGGISGGSYGGDVIALWIPQSKTKKKPTNPYNKNVKGSQVLLAPELDISIGVMASLAIFRGP
jgi:hypothetical protein